MKWNRNSRVKWLPSPGVRGEATVVIVDLDDTDAQVADDSHATTGRAEFLRANMAVSQEAETVFRTSPREYQELHLLRRNTGIQRYGAAVAPSAELWDEVFNANVKSAYLACYYGIPRMTPVRRAMAITAFVQAFASQKGVAAYTWFRGALIPLAQVLAVDHAASGIRVNAVAPDSVSTPILRRAARIFAKPDALKAIIVEWGRRHPLSREAAPEVVAFLLSQRDRSVPGAT